MNIDPDIIWYYNKGRESARLETMCQLDEVRTKRILSTRLSDPPLSIVDVGGGPGAYSFWLSQQGYSVCLVDPIPLHLEQAKARAEKTGVRLTGIEHADAENLPFEDNTFDAALLFGPLYHLVDHTRRVAALRETARVLRSGGTLFAVVISRYGAVLEGFLKGYIDKPGYGEMVQEIIANGRHANPSRQDGLFTTSYFHRVDEFITELDEAGFQGAEILTIEGPWGCIPDFERKWEDKHFRALLMKTIETLESDPSVVGFGGHIMAVVTRS